MTHHSHQVSFFLNEIENDCFIDYCVSKGVPPYVVGSRMVRDFLMLKENTIEQKMANNNLEDKLEVLEEEIESTVAALGVQVEKCEKLEEEIANLQCEIERLDNEDRLQTLEEGVDSLWDKHYELVRSVDLKLIG